MKSILDVKSVDLFNHRHPFNPQACLCRRYPEEFLIIEEQLLSSKNQNSLKASLTKPLKRSKSDEDTVTKNHNPEVKRVRANCTLYKDCPLKRVATIPCDKKLDAISVGYDGWG